MLILASASPRRSDLLQQAGFTFAIQPAHINEDPHPNEPPSRYVERLAREKAQAIFSATADKTNLYVLGADTTVTIDDEILGKPENPADATRMLRQLSGRTHAVITGVALVSVQGTQSFIETTQVTMHALTDQQIANYIATGEPMDKAGAYGIQGAASAFIASINGVEFDRTAEYTNVVGLPIPQVKALLQKFLVSN
jgi:septum formation protein